MSKKEKIKEYKIELNKVSLKAGSDTKLMLEFLQEMKNSNWTPPSNSMWPNDVPINN